MCKGVTKIDFGENPDDVDICATGGYRTTQATSGFPSNERTGHGVVKK